MNLVHRVNADDRLGAGIDLIDLAPVRTIIGAIRIAVPIAILIGDAIQIRRRPLPDLQTAGVSSKHTVDHAAKPAALLRFPVQVVPVVVPPIATIIVPVVVAVIFTPVVAIPRVVASARAIIRSADILAE